MTKWRRNILIVPGLLAFLAYIVVSLCNLVPALASPDCQLTHKWLVGLTILLLLLALSAWSAVAWLYSQRSPSLFTQRSRRVTAFKYTALASFHLLTLWFRLILGSVLQVPIPSLELWFVAMGVAWMTTPFTVLGLIHVGANLAAWLHGKG